MPDAKALELFKIGGNGLMYKLLFSTGLKQREILACTEGNDFLVMKQYFRFYLK
ncbi:hypothetical protein [Salipaludibacillus neizhouensis]|uniref:hypothetical protein n=1 Tax=Salipaludibacillus neizhouensis TaxID=885475 RepID=UPI001602078E|nr:hypothetical protein [Salipaludibacillus neizhouensis]